MIVYIYTFPNGKKYIGQTSTSFERRAENGHGYKTQLVGRAIEKYGWENIQKEIFECNSKEEMDVLERKLIALYKTQDRSFGYNITDGGEGVNGFKHSETSKEKMRKAKLGEKNPNFGKHKSEETKEKMRKSAIGKKMSEEAKIKMRENAHLAKAVRCIETNKVYPSCAAAARDIGLKSGSNIASVCDHKKNYVTSGGYHWEWAGGNNGI